MNSTQTGESLLLWTKMCSRSLECLPSLFLSFSKVIEWQLTFGTTNLQVIGISQLNEEFLHSNLNNLGIIPLEISSRPYVQFVAGFRSEESTSESCAFILESWNEISLTQTYKKCKQLCFKNDIYNFGFGDRTVSHTSQGILQGPILIDL